MTQYPQIFDNHIIKLDSGRVYNAYRFRYSDLKQLLLKAYILTWFWGFLFIFGNHMPIGIKYEKQVSSYFSVWRCGFSSANQKSKLVMPLSQVKLAGNVCHRLY